MAAKWPIRAGECWCMIGARRGSKRLPDKNIRHLGGVPLLAYPIHAARRAAALSRVIVSTEDDEIAAVARRYGAEVDRRPAPLAADTATVNDVIHEFTQRCVAAGGTLPEFLLALQPPCPFVSPAGIDAVVAAMREDRRADSLIGIAPRDGVDVAIEGDRVTLDVAEPKRSQELSPRYRISGLYYVFRIACTIERGGYLGEHIRFHLDRDPRVLADIDDEYDLLWAQSLLDRYPEFYDWLPPTPVTGP